ncbi:uncharacterized protein LOC112568377 [Pomacea canaliculata]|uniref:uncharacterized protein LOC112568377 n=1 Tax=Pomacea canaliculata TaxID=400727 RepID=UPI000D725248|nr:uncharacterized protein LOC112568377 [Pomacea canaliculata]
MTTTHRLMAAAFYLCGLLFLFHVDSVNSIKCKTCMNTGPDCHAGNVPAKECCFKSSQCVTMIFNSTRSSHLETYRLCGDDGGKTRCRPVGHRNHCFTYCCTDDCN